MAEEVGEVLDDQEIREMIQEADSDGDGHITFEDFFKVMKKNCNDPLGEFDSDDDELAI